ncbi:hypothetical protein [Capillimicrobium parvum]|uniref:Lipoprotein n=1 Tax=Capillimicrobium parvum TaxID=2884022 RepID=A0A9E6XWS6_9ACTN|nr:hypothetical protein [Capillimicrobium parvum]UGS35181.1 hypothetical protein DSM104329_01566 [Capillimicrobium parvum]
MRAGVLALVALVSPALLAGCSSTQDKAARKRAEAKTIVQQKGLEVARTNPGVKVLGSQVLHDEYGTAAVVELRNRTKADMVAVPVAIDVADADGKSVFRNDAPGLEPSLVSAALLPARERVVWVNNQVAAAGKPVSLTVRVGKAKRRAPRRVPRIEVSGLRAHRDRDGPSVTGVIRNRSKIAQKRLTVYGVARRGDRVVAAGRAVIDRLDPDPTPKPVHFTIYFIGDPTGAQLDVFAPPVTLS